MERVNQLTDILQREVMDYHGPALKAKTYYFENVDHLAFTVIIVPDYQYPRKSKTTVTVMAHIVGDVIVIDEDITDRPLYEALLQAGVPREQIVLAYAGETLPVEMDRQS
ncbi:MAG: XisI protein [Chloroflexi bacterium]|nr:XisI protein [Chloroflexota bacterium]MCC6895185.1 XisI protein [Anaerolineae bacterium]